MSPVEQVTHLVIRRPQFFHFKPGDYVYINVPLIAKYEWHPFTISSAPEQSGWSALSQHVLVLVSTISLSFMTFDL